MLSRLVVVEDDVEVGCSEAVRFLQHEIDGSMTKHIHMQMEDNASCILG